MKIRRMMQADAPYVAQIESRIFSQPWSEHAFASAASDENALFLVAVCDRPETVCENNIGERQRIVGYIGMYLSAPEGEITNVAVVEDCRGNGFGGMLVHAMQTEALARGVNQIFLEVRDSNAPAICVYTRLGFEEIAVRKGFYDFPKEDARVMRWQG